WNTSSLLRWRRFPLGSPGHITQRLASWLRSYHSESPRTPPSPGPIVTALIEDTHNKLAALRSRFPGTLSDSTLTRIEVYLSGAGKDLALLPAVSVGCIHGDLTLSNILIDASGRL